ncbi:MAG TPA: hypothetical protein VNV65_07645 [Candidatus Solibacter sp.]|jgi:hypothetical protein|nr:hypothetical protein [Candidatus Solibacter sp.]
MQESIEARQRWLDWAEQIYPGRDDIAAAAADVALETLRMGGTDDDAVGAASREVRKHFPEEASELPIARQAQGMVVTRAITVSAGEAFKVGIFGGCGFLLVVIAAWALLSAAGITFATLSRP